MPAHHPARTPVHDGAARADHPRPHAHHPHAYPHAHHSPMQDDARAHSRPPSVSVLGKLKVASGKPLGRAAVAVSHDGGYVSVTWPGARTYCVFRQGAAAWEE